MFRLFSGIIGKLVQADKVEYGERLQAGSNTLRA
jgi:hypothetical protein